MLLQCKERDSQRQTYQQTDKMEWDRFSLFTWAKTRQDHAGPTNGWTGRQAGRQTDRGTENVKKRKSEKKVLIKYAILLLKMCLNPEQCISFDWEGA